MNYLITQMWACLLIAAAIGALIGWMLRSISCNTKLEEQDAEWRSKLKQQESSYQKKQSSQPAEPVEIPKTQSIEPKSEPTSAPTTKGIQTSYEVEELEGIGSSFGSKLRDKGIATTQQLLNACETLDDRIDVANHIGIEDFVIQKWASMADLMRVSGIENTLSDLMVYSRIDSVEVLAQQEASTFLNTLTKYNSEKQLVEEMPNLTTLEIMIAEAKSLPRKLTEL